MNSAHFRDFQFPSTVFWTQYRMFGWAPKPTKSHAKTFLCKTVHAEFVFKALTSILLDVIFLQNWHLVTRSIRCNQFAYFKSILLQKEKITHIRRWLKYFNSICVLTLDSIRKIESFNHNFDLANVDIFIWYHVKWCHTYSSTKLRYDMHIIILMLTRFLY